MYDENSDLGHRPVPPPLAFPWLAGDAVLFHSMKPNGELEERSLHAACPVIRGTKWSMPKW